MIPELRILLLTALTHLCLALFVAAAVRIVPLVVTVQGPAAEMDDAVATVKSGLMMMVVVRARWGVALAVDGDLKRRCALFIIVNMIVQLTFNHPSRSR